MWHRDHVDGLSICRWTVNMSMDCQYVTAMNCQQTPTNTHKHPQTPTGATNVWLLLRSVYYPLTHSPPCFPLFPLVSPCCSFRPRSTSEKETKTRGSRASPGILHRRLRTAVGNQMDPVGRCVATVPSSSSWVRARCSWGRIRGFGKVMI